MFTDTKRTYHDALCGGGECDGGRRIVSVWQLSTWLAVRLSPSPKVISGEGLIDPRRLRQTMRMRQP
jgi:hypothetical protein